MTSSPIPLAGSGFDSLPTELLSSIIHLTNPSASDLKLLSLVHSSWTPVAQRFLWSSLLLTSAAQCASALSNTSCGQYNTSEVAFSGRKGDYLEDVNRADDATILDAECVMDVLQKLKGVTSLKVDYVPNLNPALLDLPNLPSLKRLTLAQGASFETPATLPRTLTHLEISSPSLTSFSMLTPPASLASLKLLDFDSSDPAFDTFISDLTQLSHLHLEPRHPANSHALIPFIERAPELEHLVFKEFLSKTVLIPEVMKVVSKNVKELDLSFRECAGGIGVESVSKGLEKLERLEVLKLHLYGMEGNDKGEKSVMGKECQNRGVELVI